MDSLYGGKPGISFVLKANYPSVENMIEHFAKGNNYTAVWYGEYVIIDTYNKNNADNGKIYRRGLDFQGKDENGKPTGGAEYVGQIVGPSSGTPYFELSTLEHAHEHAKIEADNDIIYKRYPKGWDDVNNCYIIDKGEGDGSDLADFKFNRDNHAMVPGKYTDESGETQYNDDILYTWVNVKDDTENDNSWFYVGFQFPYPVIDYTTEVVSPYEYDEETDSYIYKDTSQAIRYDNNENAGDYNSTDPEKRAAFDANMFNHPFWERWQINIPKGIKGDALHNFRVISIDKETKIYNVSAVSTTWDNEARQFVTEINEEDYYYDPEKDPECIDTIKHPVKPNDPNEDIKHNESLVEPDVRKILVLDYVVYDKNAEGDVYTLFIGDYNMINEVYVDDDGTIRIKMTHDNDYVYEQRIKWVDLVNLSTGDGSKGGEFTFTWNTWTEGEDGEKVLDTTHFFLSWLKSIEIDNDGSLIYTYAGRESEINEHLPQNAEKIETDADGNPIEGIYKVSAFLQWIHTITLDPETGHFEIKNNRDETILDETLDWIKAIVLDDDGTIHFIHTKIVADEEGHVERDENGVVITEEPISRDEYFPGKIKWLTEANIADTGEFELIFNNGEAMMVQQKDSDPVKDFILKQIKQIRLNTDIEDDKHIQILYNNKEHDPEDAEYTEDGFLKIGDPINYIADMVVRSTDWHLLVLYNDPEHRPYFDPESGSFPEEYRDELGHLWTNKLPENVTVQTPKHIYWRDLGTIKDQHGLLIGFNITNDEISEAGFDSALEYLDATYQGGLKETDNLENGEAIKEKIVTVGSEGENKEFYAYDYNKNEWYYLGMLADAIDARLVNLDTVTQAEYKKVQEAICIDGLLFASNYINYVSDNSFPRYWSNEQDSTMFDMETPPFEWEPLLS